ncbi:hypothetical protein GOHSU_12_00290 [Gordonia hirsuta DSM 44140 = NBRC 16056]|uniref:OsmC-like protein n=1 Tax=Gordonia hirsuta DSM 44140 = NBRC 16056 TaxID=1121927 RepID=L7L6U1_9ACTN|nr:OsmC family protein [Gordonia hirsuta]GAC56639.1 hypothetical protein GOHSU_12_00290 [Gordonia hirsuta DSM 44140 = NBRC 16056]
MQKLPHHYAASAISEPGEPITLSSPGLNELITETPPEFGGPEGMWSPETLMIAAVANCFVLTWRAVAAHNKVDWIDMRVDASGVLDRVDRVTRFTQVTQKVQLVLPAGADRAQIEQLLAKTESACLVSNSMNAEFILESEIVEA